MSKKGVTGTISSPMPLCEVRPSRGAKVQVSGGDFKKLGIALNEGV